MALNKVSIKNRGWFSRLQQVDDDSMSKISDLIILGDELEINILNDLTKKICYYDHGPAISLFELENFSRNLVGSIKELKPDHDEIFSQMLCAISQMKEHNYTICDTSLMILKSPYCVIVKFGSTSSCRFLIHLGNNVLYTMGGSEKVRPVPYSPASYSSYKSMYDTLKKDMMRAEESRILENFTGFKESLTHETYKHSQSIKDSTNNSAQYTEAIGVLLGEIADAQQKLYEKEKGLEVQVEHVRNKLLTAGNAKGKQGLYLPELDRTADNNNNNKYS